MLSCCVAVKESCIVCSNQAVWHKQPCFDQNHISPSILMFQVNIPQSSRLVTVWFSAPCFCYVIGWLGNCMNVQEYMRSYERFNILHHAKLPCDAFLKHRSGSINAVVKSTAPGSVCRCLLVIDLSVSVNNILTSPYFPHICLPGNLFYCQCMSVWQCIYCRLKNCLYLHVKNVTSPSTTRSVTERVMKAW